MSDDITKAVLPGMDAESDDGTVLSEVGTTGLRRSSGIVQEELHPKLRGRQAVRVYREMRDNDAVIGGILWAVKMLIRQAPWRIEPGGGDRPTAAHTAVADFVESCRDDMESTWQEFVEEALENLVYGFALFEKTYKIRRGYNPGVPQLHSKHNDGRYGWRDLAPRAQDTLFQWKFTDAGRAYSFLQLAPPRYVLTDLPLARLVNFRLGVNKKNPEGRSVLRNAYRSWYYLKRIQEIEAIGIERDLAGLPVMEVPGVIMATNASTEQKATRKKYETMVRLLKRDQYEGVVIPSEMTSDGKPSGYKLRLLSTGGRRSIDSSEIVRRYESRIAISVLAEFILLGMDKVGSFALADTKTALFAVAIGAVMDGICETFNRELIPELCELNGVDSELAPRLTHGDIETPDVQTFSAGILALVQAGCLTPGDDIEQRVRETLNLPAKAPILGAVPGGLQDPGVDSASDTIQGLGKSRGWFRRMFSRPATGRSA